MNVRPVLVFCMLSQSGLAQNTCYTNPQGTTICSNSGSVIHGSSDRTGNSVYRDDRGNRLEFRTDQFGNATVEPRSGEPIEWSQQVLGERKYPGSGTPPWRSPPVTEPWPKVPAPSTNGGVSDGLPGVR
jgi:hypothetical protein